MRPVLGLALVGLAGALPLLGQGPTGSIRGIVFDSLVTGAPLVGAVVELVELGRSAETDGRGVFRLDSVPGGRYTLTYSHRSLASIGFYPPDRPVSLAPGIDISITLGTPSPGTIFARLCPLVREPKMGVLLGTAREATTDTALGGAEVRAEWTVTTLARVGGMVRRPQMIRTAVEPGGRFQLCGVPTDVPVLIRVNVSATQGPPIELSLDSKAVAVRHLALDLSDSARGRRAVVAGRVTSAGQPIAGAQINLLGSATYARTRSDGSFEIAGLAAGSYTIEARMIGYGRRRAAVDLKADQTTQVSFSLDRSAVELPEVTVAARAAAAARSGFDQRRLRGVGGFFITREDIVRRGSVRVEDLFKAIPGIKVDPLGSTGYQILSLRGGAGTSAVCAPTVFLDNIRIPPDPESGNDLPIIPEEIQGIEIHQSPHSAPIEFRPMGQNCGVILIWTRRGNQ